MLYFLSLVGILLLKNWWIAWFELQVLFSQLGCLRMQPIYVYM